MSLQNGEERRDPFSDFINESLDMDGVDGLDVETITALMRHLLKNLPAESITTLWADKLDTLQEIVRGRLNMKMVMSAVRDEPSFGNADPQEIEVLITLTATLAFVCYNELMEQYDLDERRGKDDTLLAKRLRAMLKASLGWVRKAAKEGDTVADKMLQEADELLDVSDRLE
ncbi:MAG: hypothetical protein IPO91_06845 [Chloroflexi bacterium]|nr:hypothetical protein [Chloroflexota bacterium]